MKALLVTLAFLAVATSLSAQSPPAKPPLPDMQAVAAALGVTCEYCHAPRGEAPKLTANGKPRLDVGREMIAMTASLNATVQAAAGKTVREAAAVTCATCHRGVAIPRPLTDILLLTSVREGAATAVTQYRDLRSQYYGRGTYDFGEETLLAVARRLANARPEVAIPLAELNLEFFPRSVNSLVVKAIAQGGRDDEGAVATLKKALEIEPENGEIKGRLYQIEEMLARRKRLASPN
ncbi:MAG TPA: photosynthetic reaction center cytochrome c subunit family protein [Vicinamibacterales bacterium]|nr:photosynthetic reaction center cytochrome c subunit family protein [Vicinamibacterales bacterium]